MNWLTNKALNARKRQERTALHGAMFKAYEAHDEYVHSPEHLEAVAAYRQEQATQSFEAIYKIEEGKRIASEKKRRVEALVASGDLIVPSYVKTPVVKSKMVIQWQLKKQLKNLLNGTSKTITIKGVEADAVTWSWTSSNTSTIALSGQTDTTSSSSITATANAVGNATITCVMVDADGEEYSGSLKVAVSSAPVQPATLKGVSISPSSATATSNTAFNQIFSVVPNPADDGSYTYSWNDLSGTGKAGLTMVKNGSTCTVSGTPTTAGSVTVSGFAKDSYGTQHGASATITVNAAATKATLNTASAEAITAIVGQTTSSPVVLDLVDADDGSYAYTWSVVNGNGTGYGYVYVSVDGGNSYTPASTGTQYKNNPMFAISGYPYGTAPTAAGSPSFTIFIVDNQSPANDRNVTVSVTVTAAPTGENIQSVSAVSQGQGTNPGHPVKGKAFAGRYLMVTPSPADDGTYKYNWYWSSGKEGGYSGMTMTGTDTYQVYWSGTPTESGAYTLSCDVTDTQGKTVTGTGTLQVDPS